MAKAGESVVWLSNMGALHIDMDCSSRSTRVKSPEEQHRGHEKSYDREPGHEVAC